MTPAQDRSVAEQARRTRQSIVALAERMDAAEDIGEYYADRVADLEGELEEIVLDAQAEGVAADVE